MSGLESAPHRPPATAIPGEVVAYAVRAAPDLIRVMDDEGIVVYASDAAEEILGRDPKELVGQGVTGGVKGSVGDETLDSACRRARAGRKTVRVVHRAKKGDATHRWCETTIRVLRTARGQFSVLVTRKAPAPVVEPKRGFAARGNATGAERDIGPSATADARQLCRYLTDRELQVLRCLGEGLSVGEVGQRLHIRESTVRGHVKCLLHKLQVHSQLQAVLVGMEGGVVPNGLAVLERSNQAALTASMAKAH